jgi:group I intron endonuclease
MKRTTKKYIIYKAISPSDKLYIGITGVPLENRIKNHVYNSTRKDNKLSRAIKKYGIENFEWVILEENLTQENAIRKEMHYIQLYDTYVNGYNSTKGGEGAFGYKWDKKRVKENTQFLRETYWEDPEWKKKKSEITKNYYKNNPEKRIEAAERLKKARKNITKEQEERRIKNCTSKEAKIKQAFSRGLTYFNVYCIKKQKFVGTWILKTECAKELNIQSSKISSCLNGYRNMHGGYIFKYINDPTVKGKRFNKKWLKNLVRSPNKCKKSKKNK